VYVRMCVSRFAQKYYNTHYNTHSNTPEKAFPAFACLECVCVCSCKREHSLSVVRCEGNIVLLEGGGVGCACVSVCTCAEGGGLHT